MKLSRHCAISLTLSGVFYAYAGSAPGAALFLASGILVDVDHFLEYFLAKPLLKFRAADFFDFWMNKGFLKSRRVFLVLHSYEVVAVLVIAGVITGQNGVYFAALLGWLQHILLDQLANTINFPWLYSFIYRLSKGFRPGSLFHLETESFGAD